MRNKHVLWLFVIFLLSCTGGETDYVDEEHRPKDWEANVSFIVSADTINDEFEQLAITDKSISPNYQDLVDQLFDLAFSEETNIYLPNALGDISTERIDARALHDALQEFDTAYVEDLITRQQRDTIIDISFRKGNVSHLEVVCNFQKRSSQIVLTPKTVAIGEQVFSEQGVYRGFRPKFFLGLEQSSTENFLGKIALVFQTDSLGLFRASMFSEYQGNFATPFQELIGTDQNHDVEINTSFGLIFRENAMEIDPFQAKQAPPKAGES